MTDNPFKRDIEELEKHASFWWPTSLSELESSLSIIPTLLKTQDSFISILKLSKGSPQHIFDVLKAEKFPGNLFLKHLAVLADFGGELLQRLNRQFGQVFHKDKDGKYFLEFTWENEQHKYKFKELPVPTVLNNSKLGIDGKGLQEEEPLSNLMRDVCMILLYGNLANDESIAETLSKCEVGILLGKQEEIEEFVKQRYIWVSRITGGAKANKLGQIAQRYLIDSLKKLLGKEYTVKTGSIAVSKSQSIPFDVVVKKGEEKVGIEVSFQVTTNSTIERKAGQAKARYKAMRKSGYPIAYVIDGAGNFQRKSAISKICSYSDCTVAYSDNEFAVLAAFLKEVLNGD